MTKNNNIYKLKGILIIGVVIVHTLRGYISANMLNENHIGIANVIDNYICLFCMPLFMIISGYLYSKSADKIKSLKSFVYIKIKRLVVPYFIFASIQILIKIFLSTSINKENSIKDILLLPIIPVGQFWFLYALFFIGIVIYFCDYKEINDKIVFIGLLVLLIVNYIRPFKIYIIRGVAEWGIYYFIGKKISDISKICINHKYIYFGTISMITVIFYDKGLFLQLGLTLLWSLFWADFVKEIKSNLLILIGKESFNIFLLHIIFGSGIRILLNKIGISNIFLHLIFDISGALIIPIVIGKFYKLILYRNYKEITTLN